MLRRTLALLIGLALLPALVLTGCSQGPPRAAQTGPPVVPVSQPLRRQVTDFVDFTGRTDAVNAVDIRARVTGYLAQMEHPFKEGAEVKKGDLLFEIDRRPYEAQHEQALGQVTLAQAQLKLAKSTYARDQGIAANTPGAISKQQLDQDQAAVEEGEARVRAYNEALKVYKLNLGFTRVTSPIDGQVSRYYYTPGNLVAQDQTLLTTIVSMDPMYVYFDMDEPTLQRINRAMNEGRMKKPEDLAHDLATLGAGTFGLLTSPVAAGPLAATALYPGREIGIPVYMGLQGEEGYPHPGIINFINNQVNPTTGSISVRGVFPNDKGKRGVRLLRPGMFVRIHLPIGEPHPALLVIDRAIASDQGLKYVYVVDGENKVQYRRVKVGALQDDGLRVIREGLQPDDWVVVGALQQVRPKMVVQPDRVAMPTIGPATEPAPTHKDKEKE